MTGEQGAEESILGSMGHIMVLYNIEIFRLALLGILTHKFTNCTLQD